MKELIPIHSVGKKKAGYKCPICYSWMESQMKEKKYGKNLKIPEAVLWCPQCKQRFEYPPSDVPQKTPEQDGKPVGFLEMTKAVESGKVMARLAWKNRYYLDMDSFHSQLIECCRDTGETSPYSPTFTACMATDWVETTRREVKAVDYPQLRKGVGFHEMVAAVEAGKVMRRSGWKKYYIKISTFRTELWWYNRDDADDVHPYSPSIEDYCATDWVP